MAKATPTSPNDFYAIQTSREMPKTLRLSATYAYLQSSLDESQLGIQPPARSIKQTSTWRNIKTAQTATGFNINIKPLKTTKTDSNLDADKPVNALKATQSFFGS